MKLKVAIIFALSALLLLFLAGSFIAMSLNPSSWHISVRSAFVFLSMAIIIFVTGKYFD